MNRRISSSISQVMTFFTIFLTLAACAKIHVNTIPPPPSTTKLRVCILPSTGNGNWQVPHEEFAQWVTRVVEQHLKATGMYEVVGRQDISAVLGDQDVPRWQLERDGWELAKKIGKALQGDYVLSIERSFGKTVGGQDFTIDNVMINVKTGKKFGAWYIVSRPTQLDRDRINSLIREAHRTLFVRAKKDMLATAIQKSKSPAGPQKTGPATSEPQVPKATTEPFKEDQRKPAMKPSQAAAIPQGAVERASEQQSAQAADASSKISKTTGTVKGIKLAVFDFDASENTKTIALILSEALREEFSLLKQFVLVNRENLQQVLRETALQQTGLIDEKQAVKTGKGMAVSRVVIGRLGLIGKTYVLQAKLIDVETLATLGLASTRFKEGEEDNIFSKMPELAKNLAGLK